jgi:hypothetical protein
MTRTADLNTGRHALAFPENGKLRLVMNTDNYLDKAEALMRLSDRIANGEAFPHEVVVELWMRSQWSGEHSGGNESFSSYLYPK